MEWGKGLGFVVPRMIGNFVVPLRGVYLAARGFFLHTDYTVYTDLHGFTRIASVTLTVILQLVQLAEKGRFWDSQCVRRRAWVRPRRETIGFGCASVGMGVCGLCAESLGSSCGSWVSLSMRQRRSAGSRSSWQSVKIRLIRFIRVPNQGPRSGPNQTQSSCSPPPLLCR